MDMTLIKDVLVRIENGQHSFSVLPADSAAALGIEPETKLTRQEAKNLEDHLNLLEERGLIKIMFRSGGGNYAIDGLTLQGRDFLRQLKG
ncbi:MULTISPECIES: DUF2513 domain-containing protein [Bacteria]|uniref:DUF2513 domain-containing protein n=1 Tax=Bacteria TaxID=2 RepID=UPI00313E413B